MENKIFKILKDNSFILYASLSIFLVTIINKLILFIYYSLPIELLHISIEDLYINGILVAIIIILLFFFIFGLALVLEMLIITFLPRKARKKAYEVIIILYILYPICIYTGIIEFIITGQIERTKSTTILISVVFGIGLVIGILVKIILNIFKLDKKNKSVSISDEPKYIFKDILDSTGIRKVIYILVAFFLLIGLTTSIQISSLKNKKDFLIYKDSETSYALIIFSQDTFIFKRFENGKMENEYLLKSKSEPILLIPNK